MNMTKCAAGSCRDRFLRGDVACKKCANAAQAEPEEDEKDEDFDPSDPDRGAEEAKEFRVPMEFTFVDVDGDVVRMTFRLKVFAADEDAAVEAACEVDLDDLVDLTGGLCCIDEVEEALEANVNVSDVDWSMHDEEFDLRVDDYEDVEEA